MAADLKPRLELFTRTEIAPPNRRILLKMLRELRNNFEMISVRCVSNEAALVAARDRRVDTVLFPCDGNLRMSAGVASTCRNLLEVELQPLIMGQGERRRTCFLRLRRDVRRALNAGIPVVASSGARDLLQQRSPMALSSILTALGLGRSESIKAIGSPTFSSLRQTGGSSSNTSWRSVRLSPRKPEGRPRDRLRRRYVRAIVQCRGSPPTKEELVEVIIASICEAFGLRGLAEVSPTVVFYDRGNGVIVVRCTHSGVDELCAALALINCVKSSTVSVNPETVSGLMRSLRNRALG